jgi:DNA polymerase (family 10)
MSKIKNAEVAKILHEIADLLEIQEIQFKPAAYRRAAQNIEMLSENIEDIYKQDKLKESPGVGEGISSKIQEYLKTGTLKYLEGLKKEIPEGLNELIKIEGIGPKTAIKLHKELGIKTVNDLELAINTGKFKELRGFGEKKVESFVRGIELYKSAQGRHLLGNILPVAEEIVSQLRKSNLITKISIAGSIRRKNETVGDIDI